MAGRRIVIPNLMPALDANGSPVSGAKLYFYENRTTTLAAVWANEALTVPLTNPVVADVGGVFPSIFADDADVFTVAITDSLGAAIANLRNQDDVRPSVSVLADDGAVVLSSSSLLASLGASSVSLSAMATALGYAAPGDGGKATWIPLTGDYQNQADSDEAGAIWREDDGGNFWKNIEPSIVLWHFGAKGDAVSRTTGVAVSGDATFTDSGASFSADDVGKYFTAEGIGAGGVALKTTIAAVNSETSIELADAPSTSRSLASGTINGVAFTTGRMTAGYYMLEVTGASFTDALVGTAAVVNGADTGGGNLSTTVAVYVNATTLILKKPAVTTVGGVEYAYCSLSANDPTKTADTYAIQKMNDLGLKVFLPRRTPENASARYLVNDTIEFDRTGAWMEAENPEVSILADDFDGPVIDVLTRRSTLRCFTIDSTGARKAMPFKWGRCHIRYGGENQISVQTSTFAERLNLRDSPGCGIEKLRTGSYSIFSQITIDDPHGHGFYLGDGATQGLTADRPGILDILMPSIHGAGGQCVRLSESGQTNLRVRIINSDLGNNCWNGGPFARGLSYSNTAFTDGAITAGDKTFTSAAASFTSANIGDHIKVVGAGGNGATLVTAIASINSSTSVELEWEALTTVSGASGEYGKPLTETAASGDFSGETVAQGNHWIAPSPKGIPELRAAEVVLRGQEIIMDMPGTGDRDYAKHKLPRKARGTLIYVASQSRDVHVTGGTRLMNGDVLFDVAEGCINCNVDIEYTNYGPDDDGENTLPIPLGARYGEGSSGTVKIASLTKEIAGVTYPIFTVPVRVNGATSRVRVLVAGEEYRPVYDNNAMFNVNGKEGATTFSDGAMTSGSATFTSAAATFTDRHIGKRITVAGAGAAGAILNATITARASATSVTLSVSAGTTVSGAVGAYGTPGQDGDGIIVSGLLTPRAGHVELTGEGGAADDLSEIYLTSGKEARGLPDTWSLILYNKTAYNITLKQKTTGTTNLNLIGGYDKVLKPNDVVTFRSTGDGQMREVGALEAAGQSVTIASGVLIANAPWVNLSPEGGAADDLDLIQFSSGVALPNGRRITLFNASAYAITLRHDQTGTGKLYLTGGRNKVLNPNQAVTLDSYDGKLWGGGDLPDAQTGGGPVVSLENGSTFTFSAVSSGVFYDITGMSVSAEIKKSGWYDVRGNVAIVHRDSAASNYQFEILRDSTVLNGNAWNFEAAGTAVRQIVIESRRRWIDAGTYTFKLVGRQSAYATVYGQVNTHTDTRQCYFEIVPAP